MKRPLTWRSLLIVAAAAGTLHGTSVGEPRAASKETALTIRGSTNCPVIPSSGGPVYLELLVRADHHRRPIRRPVNLTVVVDRSGSMGSQQKIENARSAVRAIIDQLQRDDIFSLVMYDDEVEVLSRSARVGDKDLLRCLVDEITPRGWTNLGGGLIEGIHQTERHAREDYINRVILLSDGLANRGITDPRKLGRITERAAHRGISLSAMGVGWDFNEELMVSLAEHGGGNYYFIESPRDLASVFRKEFTRLGDIVASGTVIELRLDLDVRVRDVIGYGFEQEDGWCSIAVGDLMDGEERSIIVALDVPAGNGDKRLASGTVRSRNSESTASFTSSVTYGDDPSVIERERDLNVQARADVAVSTRLVEEALAALDAGDEAAAASRLDAAQETLECSQAAGGAEPAVKVVRDQKERLEQYRRAVNEEGRRAKKAIHYDNYQRQKKQQ